MLIKIMPCNKKQKMRWSIFMKRKIFLAILVVVQSLWIAPQAYAMDDISRSEQYARSREQRLSGFFNQIFGVDIQINGDTVNLKGTQDQLDGAIAKLNNFNLLRVQFPAA